MYHISNCPEDSEGSYKHIYIYDPEDNRIVSVAIAARRCQVVWLMALSAADPLSNTLLRPRGRWRARADRQGATVWNIRKSGSGPVHTA